MLKRLRRSISKKNLKKMAGKAKQVGRKVAESEVPAVIATSISTSEPEEEEVWSMSSEDEQLLDKKRMCDRYGSCDDYVQGFCKKLDPANAKELQGFLSYARNQGVLKPNASIEDVKMLCKVYRESL